VEVSQILAKEVAKLPVFGFSVEVGYI